MISIPEDIKKELNIINEVAKDLKMKIYIVGGFPRDIVSGNGVNNDTDLDITEENGNAFDLAFFVSAKYDLPEPVIYESSGTALVVMPSGREVEFHNSYYNVPHIVDQLYLLDVEPNSINKDIYSRDFTINTLLLDPYSNEIIDITKKGISDIKNKILRTPLSPSKTLSINPKIILRGIRFKLQMGLKEDPKYTETVMSFVPYLIKFLEEHPNSKMVERTVKKTFESNPKMAYEEYRKIGILEYIPRVPEIDSIIKEEIFGTTISPTSFEASRNIRIVQAQETTMIKHLLEEREKHKAYVRRKKRERQQRREEKFEILDNAKRGYYLNDNNNEEPKGKKKDTGRPGYDFYPKKRRV